MKAVFLRALNADDKAAALRAAIHADGTAIGRIRFDVDATSFAAIPRSPFAYWVSERLRDTFRTLPALAADGRLAASGGKTLDDFRWIRTSWEISRNASTDWVGFAKGGAYSPFYSDINLLLNWHDNARSLKVYLTEYRRSHGWSPNWTAELHGCEHYLRPGLTWPRRTNGLSFRVLPEGCVFADKGPAIFVEDNNSSDLMALCAIANSAAFALLVSLQLARTELAQSFEVGLIQRTPVPRLDPSEVGLIAALASRVWSLKRSLDMRVEISHAFRLPALINADEGELATRARIWVEQAHATEAEVVSIQAEIDDLCFRYYGIGDADRLAATESLDVCGEAPGEENEGDAEDDLAEEESEACEDGDPSVLVVELVSWALGVAFGRFDVRLATGVRTRPVEPEPFGSLPICAPGMLTRDDGLPCDRAPPGYPIEFPTRGILVDDMGHPLDLITALQCVFRAVFGGEGEARWEEAAHLLAPGDHGLRKWLADAFFEYHLKRYSKSRRKAPIYWQFGLPSGQYSVWLYAHRVTHDSLFELQNDVVGPKLAHEERRLADMRAEAADSLSATKRREVESQERIVDELRMMLEEVTRVAPLWSPSLDDGVVLVMAPLWRLVPRHKAWQRELKSRWDELVAGTYEWAHVAMYLWPERVVPKCVIDRSLAIAHGLEDAFWVEALDGRWRQRSAIDVTIRYLGDGLLAEALRTTAEELQLFARQHIDSQSDAGWWVDLKSGRLDDTPLALALWPERVLRKAHAQPSMLTGLGLPTPARGFDDRALNTLLTRHRPRHTEAELEVLDAFCACHGDAAAWEARWSDFDAGRLDEQPLARFLYPKRVVARALKDHAFAASHGLARWFWLDSGDAPRRLQEPAEEIAIAIAEGDRPAVKAALKAFLDAPVAAGAARRQRQARSA